MFLRLLIVMQLVALAGCAAGPGQLTRAQAQAAAWATPYVAEAREYIAKNLPQDERPDMRFEGTAVLAGEPFFEFEFGTSGPARWRVWARILVHGTTGEVYFRDPANGALLEAEDWDEMWGEE